MGQMQAGAPVSYLTDYAKGIGFNAVDVASRILVARRDNRGGSGGLISR